MQRLHPLSSDPVPALLRTAGKRACWWLPQSCHSLLGPVAEPEAWLWADVAVPVPWRGSAPRQGCRATAHSGGEKQLPRARHPAGCLTSQPQEGAGPQHNVSTTHSAARSGNSPILPKPKAASRTPGPAALALALEPAPSQPGKRRCCFACWARSKAGSETCRRLCTTLCISDLVTCCQQQPVGSLHASKPCWLTGHSRRPRLQAERPCTPPASLPAAGRVLGHSSCSGSPTAFCSNSTVLSARDRDRQQTVAAAAQPPDNLQPVAFAKSLCVPDAPPNSHPRSQRVVLAKLGWKGAESTTRKPSRKLPAHLSVML